MNGFEEEFTCCGIVFRNQNKDHFMAIAHTWFTDNITYELIAEYSIIEFVTDTERLIELLDDYRFNKSEKKVLHNMLGDMRSKKVNKLKIIRDKIKSIHES